MNTHVADLDLAAFIIQTICAQFHLEPSDLESAERPWRLVWPRWLAVYLIAKYTHMSHDVLGALFNRSGNSVRDILQRSMPAQLQTDERAREKLFQLETYILAYVRRPSQAAA